MQMFASFSQPLVPQVILVLPSEWHPGSHLSKFFGRASGDRQLAEKAEVPEFEDDLPADVPASFSPSDRCGKHLQVGPGKQE